MKKQIVAKFTEAMGECPDPELLRSLEAAMDSYLDGDADGAEAAVTEVLAAFEAKYLGERKTP